MNLYREIFGTSSYGEGRKGLRYKFNKLCYCIPLNIHFTIDNASD